MSTKARYEFDERGYIDRRVDAVSGAELTAPVRSLLRDPGARVTSFGHERVAYDFLNPSSGGIYRFSGIAATANREVPWSLVLKVTRSPDSVDHGRPVPPELAASLREAVLWDRELRAYESGFLSRLPGDLTAPAYHAGERFEDDTCWLWLDDLGGEEEPAWSLADWAVVGRALGRFNGAYLAGESPPTADWLGRRWLRVWVTQITPFHFAAATGPNPGWERPAVRQAYPRPLRERIWRLWSDRESFLRAVERLPRTCCHLDAHRRNLFLRGTRVVAIDWGLLGLAAPGEELASTLVGTVASGEARAEDAAALTETLFGAYLAGLREAGYTGGEDTIRLGFAAAAGLRALSVLNLDGDEDAVRRGAALAAFLADLGDEARQTIRRAPP